MIGFTDRSGIIHIDFAATARIAKRKSNACLGFAIRDCQQAIDAFPDGLKAGYYADEISIYAGELTSRNFDGELASRRR